MKLLELGAALKYRLSQIEQDIIESERLGDMCDRLSIALDELVDTSPEWNRHENEREREAWFELSPHEATNEFDHRFCYHLDVIPDELCSFTGFKKAALMILVSHGFDELDCMVARSHLEFAQNIDVHAGPWPNILSAMHWLYYRARFIDTWPLIELLAKHGWEWTGATYDQPDVPITHPVAV